MIRTKYFLMVLFFLVLGCQPYKNTENAHYIIWIKNQTDRDLIFGYEPNDTSFRFIPTSSDSRYSTVERGKTKKDVWRDPLEFLIKDSGGVLYIVFYDAKVISTIPHDTIAKYKMQFLRKSYTKSELDSLDWVVTVP